MAALGAVGRNGGVADSSVHTAITRVQSKGAVTTGSQASLSAAFDAAPTSGNTLIAAASSDATLTMTSSGWALVGSVINATGHYMWTKIAGASEPTTVTVTPSVARTAELYIEEIHGLTDSPLDVHTTNDPNVNATSIASGTTGTTAQADEYAIASFSWSDPALSGASLSTLTNPPHVAPRFVEIADLRGTDPVDMDTMLGVAARMLDATGTVAATAILTGVGGKPTGIVATFKAGVAGGTTHERAAAMTVACAIATAGQRDLHRASALSTAPALIAAGQRDVLRNAALTTAPAIATAGQRDLQRAVALATALALTIAGQAEDTTVTHEGAASFSATFGISVAAQRDLLRAVAIAATTSLTAQNQTDVQRAVALSTLLALAVAGTAPATPVGRLEAGSSAAFAESGAGASFTESSSGVLALIE